MTFGQTDAKALEKVDVVRGEGTIDRISVREPEGFGLLLLFLGFHLIEPNGGFKHKEDFKSLVA